MPISHARRCPKLVSVLLVSLLAARALAQPCPPAWAPGAGVRGVDGPVFASIVHDDGSGPSLFAGGGFGVAGNTRVHGVARWDGQAWHSVGALGELPEDFSVGALAVYNGAIVAGGWNDWTSAPSDSALFRWDGTSWAPLPTGAGTYTTSMTVFNGNLIVAGNIVTPSGQGLGSVAVWDGAAWSTLGSAPISSLVNAVLPYQGDLFVGGSFRLQGDTLPRTIARFDGTSWTTPGGGVGGREVAALAEYHGELIATGNFGSSGLSPIACIARWDGVSWKPLGEGFDQGGNGYGGLAMTVFRDELFVGGQLDFWDRTTCDLNLPWSIAHWDGLCWRSAGAAPFSSVLSLAVFNDSLFAGGWDWGIAGNTGFWNGAAWTGTANPYAGPVTAVSSLDGSLVVGGYFDAIGDTPARHVAVRRDGRWEPLGGGTDLPVHAFAVYRGQLVAGGSTEYQTTSSRAGGRIQAWNGSEWVHLASGLTSGASADSLLVVGDDLIGVGFFPFGDTVYSSMARWDGLAWHPMGAGYSDVIGSLTSFNGDLLGAGRFNGLGNCVARWDGQAWVRMGDTLPSFPTSIEVYQGNLYAAGRDFIARLDGSTWTRFADVQPSDKCLLHEHNGSLYAASRLVRSGAQWAGSIVRFDGTGWVPVAGGFNVVVSPFGESQFTASVGVLASDASDLLFGGNFTRAGDTVSAYLARLAPSNPADVNLDGVLDSRDLLLLVSAFDSGSPAADLNHDGFVDGIDYDLFMNSFAAGC